MAPFPIGTFVEAFLDREKEDARRLIRHEMESMLDPLVESLFKQLKAKFVNYVEASCGHEQEHQLEHDLGGDAQMFYDQKTILNAQQYYCQSLDNVQLEPQLNDNSVNSSHESSLFPESMIAPNSTDDLPDTEMHQQQLSRIKHNQFDDEDEDDCDCDECVYGGIDVKEEDEEEDVDDSVQLIEDDQEEESSSRPVKRPRIDSTQNPINTQPEITNQFPRQPIDEAQSNQVNNHDKQFITVRLHCPELGCLDTFGENELNDHLMNEHSIRPHRCLVKDCKQSFDVHRILGQHIKQTHQHTTQWHCDKCCKYFAKYQRLLEHNFQYHQLGQFQCAFPPCTFTAQFRRKIYDHYRLKHKPDFVCHQLDCGYRTKKLDRFKAHQRAHLGIKPYRCNWPNCDYSSASQHNTMKHIKQAHFSSKTNLSGDVALSGKPKDYLEVILDLL